MNVQVVRLPQSQVSLDIEVDSAAVGNAIDRAYQRLSQRYAVPGFRKGKAPRAVLESAIGRPVVLEEAADIAVNDAYKQALDQTKLDPITSPEIDLQGNGLDPSQPLFFSAKFYVRPMVELGDYASIRREPPKTVIDDDAVEAAIKRMAEAQAPWEPVEDRPAEMNDVATLKMTEKVGDETVYENDEFELFLNPNGPGDAAMPDLAPHIVGMALGETRDFEVTLPEGFRPEEHAGKIMACHAELLRLERKAAPIIDDAFAQSIGEYETLDALRVRVRENMEARQRMEDAEQYVADVVQEAVDGATVDLAPPLVEAEIHRTLDNLRAEIESRRTLTMDLYLRVMGQTMDDLHEQARGPSEARVKSNLVLEAIAEAEGIAAPREQVDAELRELAALPTVRERDRRRILTDPTVRGRIETRLKRRLALQRLLAIANPADDSADTESSAAATDQHLLQQAAESHADALESATHQPGTGEEES